MPPSAASTRNKRDFWDRKRRNRQEYRVVRNNLFHAVHKAASTERPQERWPTDAGSANADIIDDLPTMRARSRQLIRDNAVARAGQSRFTNNVVGRGFTPQVRVDKDRLGITESQATEFADIATRLFEEWSPHCDAAGRLSFNSALRLIADSVFENGESLALLPFIPGRPKAPLARAVDLIEPDRLETPPDKYGADNMAGGVEMGEWGQPTRYHIRKTHPGELVAVSRWNDFDVYGAHDAQGRPRVLHLYRQHRAAAARGVPLLSACLRTLRDLGEGEEAEIIAWRMAAALGLVIETSEPESYENDTDETDADGRTLELWEPGITQRLRPGEKIHSFQSQRPNTEYEGYIRAQLRKIASALDMPYEVLAFDFSRMNYSSARTALLEFRRYCQVVQSWLAESFCRPLWQLLLEEAHARNLFPRFVNYLTDPLGWAQVVWVPQPWAWVDPAKEAIAAEKAVALGSTSVVDECTAQGREWRRVVDHQLERERYIRERREELGLPPPVDDSLDAKETEEDAREIDKDD